MNSTRTGDVGRLKDAAAEWILRQHSVDWSESDAAELQQWMRASTTNRVAYLRARATWEAAERLKVLGAGIAPGVVPSPEELTDSAYFKRQPGQGERVADRGLHRALAMNWRLAATVLVTLCGCAIWYYGSFSASEYSTAVGVTSTIPLPDGSRVTLNTNSEVRVAVSEAGRSVTLEQGEAFFEVAKDPNRPFVVRAGPERIVVLGTKFSVRRANDEVRVVVTEGRVWVNGTQIAAGGVAHSKVARDRTAQLAVEQRALPEAEEMLSWRSGFVVFHETLLKDAVAEFNRYNDKQIVIRDPRVAELKVSGNFKMTYLDAFINLLEDGFPVRVERQGRRVVLTARAAESSKGNP